MPWMRWNSPPRRIFFYRLENEGKKKKTYFRDFHCCVIQASEILSVAAGVERELKYSASCLLVPRNTAAPQGRRRALDDNDLAKTLRPSKVSPEGYVVIFILLSVVNPAVKF